VTEPVEELPLKPLHPFEETVDEWVHKAHAELPVELRDRAPASAYTRFANAAFCLALGQLADIAGMKKTTGAGQRSDAKTYPKPVSTKWEGHYGQTVVSFTGHLPPAEAGPAFQRYHSLPMNSLIHLGWSTCTTARHRCTRASCRATG
jgi:hypothetical protein